MRGIRDDLGRAALRHVDAGNHRQCGGGDHRARPQRVDADAGVTELLGHAQYAHAHAVLGDRIGDVRPEPARRHVERRRHRQHLRIAAARGARDDVRQARLRAGVGAAQVDGQHQVDALHRRRPRAGQADRAGVVDQDVDAAEARDALGDRGSNHCLVANVARHRQRVAAGGLDRSGRGMDRSGQARIRFSRLGGDDHVGAVARRAQRDRKADATRRAGDEQRPARKCAHCVRRRIRHAAWRGTRTRLR